MVSIHTPSDPGYHIPQTDLRIHLEGHSSSRSSGCNRPVCGWKDRPGMIFSLAKILETLPVKARVKEYNLLKDWDRLVGQQIARQCQPDKLKDGTLFLKVSSSAWMQQLHFMKSMILDKLKTHPEGNSVKDLRFRIGRVEQLRQIGGRPWKDIDLTKEELSQINKDVSSVKDIELREIMKKIRYKQEQVRAWKGQRSNGSSSFKAPS